MRTTNGSASLLPERALRRRGATASTAALAPM